MSIVVLVLTLSMSLLSLAPVGAHGGRCLAPNIRVHRPWIASALCGHLPRSATLRRLHAAVRELPLIVYVDQAPDLDDRWDGRLSLVGASGRWTYLRIDLRADLRGAQAASVLAHELQHALEVWQGGVTDQRSFGTLYARIGFQVTHGRTPSFDTRAAIDAGMQTLHELTGREPALSAGTSRALRAAGLQ